MRYNKIIIYHILFLVQFLSTFEILFVGGCYNYPNNYSKCFDIKFYTGTMLDLTNK